MDAPFRDIYENNANMATRRLRARILAILPADLVDATIDECEKTLKGDNSVPLIDRVKALVVRFGKLGVPAEMIETRLGKTVDHMTGEEYAEYVGIYNSIKDETSKISEWFETPPEASELTKALKEKGAGA